MAKIDLKTIINKEIKIKDDLTDKTYTAIGFNIKEKAVIYLETIYPGLNGFDVIIHRTHVKNVIIV